MAKLDLNRKLQTIAVACIIIVFSASAITLYDSQRTLTAKDFPLEVNVNRSVFYVGENFTFTASIINRSGRDVNIASNGQQPFAFIRNINDNITRVEICPLVLSTLKNNENMSRTHEYKFTESGTYVLEARYQFDINNVEFRTQHANITIEVR